MPQRLKTTWVALILAALFVMGSGTLIFRSFLGHVFVECRGHLLAVSQIELSEHGALQTTDPAHTGLDVRFDEVRGRRRRDRDSYKNVRVVWNRTDAPCGCSDVRVRWPTGFSSSYSSPGSLRIDRDNETGLFVVRAPSGKSTRGRELNTTTALQDSPPLAVFRKIDDRSHRFQSERVFEPNNLSMLIFLLSLGALAIAAARALRATPYAHRMHAWHPGILRHDGHVESETGASLGTMELRSRVPAGPVIVDPRAFEGHDAYRAMPILTRRTVGVGTHQRWNEGTMRRLRDARSLAVVATMTTLFAVVAQIVAG